MSDSLMTPSETSETRPWPVVLLTGLGAWLAAVPLIIVVGMLFGDFVTRGAGPYLIGLLVLAGSLVVLHSRQIPLFVEQLAVPGLIVGGGVLAFGLFRDLPDALAFATLGAVALAAAVLVRADWLRALLGALAAATGALALAIDPWRGSHATRLGVFWLAWHGCVAAWLAAHVLVRRIAPVHAAVVEPVSAGWLLATLCGLAWWAGMTFLVGANLGEFGSDVVRGFDRSGHHWTGTLQQLASLALAVAGALWAARRWPGLRRPWLAGVAAVLALLACLMPTLGAVLLVLALSITTRRWRLAAAAGVAAAWIIGAFYYQLAWPLAHKALLMVAAGAVLALLARWGSPRRASSETAAPAVPPAGLQRWGIAACAVAVLAVANIAIWQKESLIAHGQPVFVELAPADPRSLMQGDFMRLNFRMPPRVAQQLDGDQLRAQRPHAVARRDERNVLTLLRLDDGSALAADELRIELTPKGGDWILVTDAWFFREGEAQRWSGARYGEFRIDDNGRALLVGLRGPDLQPL
ncbi:MULTISPECIES: GDYXXLXY domain-containing protein [unclassified Rhizobacter]|uniref:GDYXXLXY domain-containing protein n=1 Tax=unclassified Rhizobacter TaxID=2640088 RepID=UPI0009EB7FC9|nr:MULTISPECIES: GDYXXLXY domain-containing protein [unclassified Rhizobacter]